MPSVVTTHHTTCPLDCPDTCTLEVTVSDGRIARIDGTEKHSLTAGFVCSKVRKFDRRVYHPERLLRPLRRVGPKGAGEFEPIQWDDALGEIAGRLRTIVDEWGGEAVVPCNYGGSNGFLSDGFIDGSFFASLGASRLAKTICAAPSSAVAQGMYGKMAGVAFEDFVHARCIVIWGANPKASNIHLVPILQEARRRGAFVAAVDPVRNFSPGEIDLHLPVSPGSDLPVALAMINRWAAVGALDSEFLGKHTRNADRLLRCAADWTIDRAAAIAGVDPELITTLSDRISQSSPTLIRGGWGTERNRNGGQALAAILAMPALLGKFGVRGGGYAMSNSGVASLKVPGLRRANERPTRELNMSRLGRLLNELNDPPLKGLFVYNCNPVATLPDQNTLIRGLERDDLFTVVFDQVMTDTAAYADVVLPATTFLEAFDVRRGYGAYVVGGTPPVIEPVGEARSNPRVFRDLALTMGYDREPFTWDEDRWVDEIAAGLRMPRQTPVTADELRSGLPQLYDFPDTRPVQFVTVRPATADGLVDLCPPQLGGNPFGFEEVVDREYPLSLISPALPGLVSSTFGESNYAEMYVTINPGDAAGRGIETGDAVRVFNGLGEVRCRARTSDRVTAGTAVIPKGAWRKSSLNGSTANALCPDSVNVVAGGACYNDARVEIEKGEVAP